MDSAEAVVIYGTELVRITGLYRGSSESTASVYAGRLRERRLILPKDRGGRLYDPEVEVPWLDVWARIALLMGRSPIGGGVPGGGDNGGHNREAENRVRGEFLAVGAEMRSHWPAFLERFRITANPARSVLCVVPMRGRLEWGVCAPISALSLLEQHGAGVFVPVLPMAAVVDGRAERV